MNVGKIVNQMIKNGRSADDIGWRLEGNELAPCVILDWENEIERRAKMKARQVLKKENRYKLSRKDKPYRRIIKSIIWPTLGSLTDKNKGYLGIKPIEFQLHATKGWRQYRVAS